MIKIKFGKKQWDEICILYFWWSLKYNIVNAEKKTMVLASKKKKPIPNCYLTVSMIGEASSEQMIRWNLQIPIKYLPLIKLLKLTLGCYFIKEKE